jgi:Rho GDP-dissociation inhibitor
MPVQLASARLTFLSVVPPEEAPSGMIARGHYDAVSKFIDDDNVTHLKFEWSFDITKSW